MMTLQQLLEEGSGLLQANGVTDALLDARLLLFSVFDMNMVHFLLDKFRPLPDTTETAQKISSYRELIQKRSRRIPLQHLLGEQEFMGLPFFVNKDVLIPDRTRRPLWN